MSKRQINKAKKVSQPGAWQAKLLVGLMLVVGAVVLAVHWPVLSAQAVSLDDDKYIEKNLLVQNPGWASVRRFFTEVTEPSMPGYYQPMTMVSLMIDYALGGRYKNPQQFHRTSLALHVANTTLVILLLYLLFSRALIAAGVGLLFGLHPINVEPIAWLSERTTMLGSFFALLCLILYVRYGAKKNWKLYLGCLVMYLLALISKPTTISVPLLMLLLDYWPLRRWEGGDKAGIYRQLGRAVRQKLPFFILAGIFAFITFVSRGRMSGSPLIMPTEYNFWRVPLLFCHNNIFYLYKIVWPGCLSYLYPFCQPLGLSDPMILASVIGTAVLIVLLVVSRRWTEAVLTGWLIYFAALAPTIQIIGFSNTIAGDKYVYLPSIGLLMLLAWALGRFCGLGKSVNRPVLVTITILVLAVAESGLTRRHLALWRDTVGLYGYMVTLTPNSAVVHNQLGYALKLEGRFDEAIEHFNEALRCNPKHFKAHNNMGTSLTALGRLDEAVDYFNQTLQLRPNYVEAYYNLGVALSRQGKLDEAVKSYHKALELRPDFPKAHNNLANIISDQGKIDEAIWHYRCVMRLQPNYAEAYNNLGSTLASQGKFDEAISYFYQALQIRPDYVMAHHNLGNAFQLCGEPDKAIRHYRRVLEIKPDFAAARRHLNKLIGQGAGPKSR